MSYVLFITFHVAVKREEITFRLGSLQMVSVDTENRRSGN